MRLYLVLIKSSPLGVWESLHGKFYDKQEYADQVALNWNKDNFNKAKVVLIEAVAFEVK